jgi:hypothetical protein
MEPISNLSSWSQAFEEFPIVQTRAIEKQLRADIAHNKQKLRNLVGGSYRDLLSTADQIVALDAKTAQVEAQISELGRNCRPKQYVPSNNNSLQQSNVAQLSLLHRCSSCIASCLKAGRVILAAKLLAISRLLHTSLSKQKQAPGILDILLDQLSRSRRRLLRRIDRRLDDASIEKAELIEAISAFCLATSSSFSDAIHHFQRRRLGQIHRSAQGAHRNHQHTTKTFKYYIDSLRTTKLLLGQEVPRALQKLQQAAILQDPDVLHLEHLNLNSLRILMPNEVQTFTPYIKKSALSEHEAKTLLETWSEEAFNIVRSQLVTHLETLADTSSAFRLRQDLLMVGLQSCFSTPAHVNIIDTLRATINEHILSLMQEQISGIAKIATCMVDSSHDIHETSHTKVSANTTTPTIWSATLVTTPMSKTANSFLTQLKAAHLGSTPSLHELSCSLTTWCASITNLRQQITSLKQIRWQDSLEESEDTDEETAKAILRTLSIDDPTSYSENLSSNLEGSITSFQDRIATAANASTSINDSLFLLRAIREATLHLSASFPELSLSHLHATIPHLHSVLAGETVSRLSATMETSHPVKQIASAHLPANLPSPAAFATLRTLCTIMLELGGIDIWTSAAVKVVKEVIMQRIFDEEHKKHYLRNEFDEVYLRTALGGSMDELQVESGVRKPAVEYWSRTRLLFGVLDP